MKYYQKNLTTFILSSLIGLISLIEFNHQLRNIKSKHQKVDWARLTLHDRYHHFCTKNRNDILLDEKRIFITTPSSEAFFYFNNKIFLRSHDDNGLRINQINLSNKKGYSDNEVWVFGDSFTYGAISDNTETIPTFLSILNNQDINFKNLGLMAMVH